MPNEFDTFRKTPPRDIRELFRRLDVCEGIPFGALITAEERANFERLWNRSGAASVKSWHADLVEAILGNKKDNQRGRDLSYAEVKIIPVIQPKYTNRRQKYPFWPVPKEDTKLCSFSYNDLLNTEFIYSSVYRKLSSILFVPIVWGRTEGRIPEDYFSMYMINSFMWVPNTDLISKLEEDYNKVRQSLVQQLKSGTVDFSSTELELEPHRKETDSILYQKSGGGQLGSDVTKIRWKGKEYQVKVRTWWLSKSFTYNLMQYVMFNNNGDEE